MNIRIFSCGNSARGDDAAGEMFHNWLSEELRNRESPLIKMSISLTHDFQLQPEHIYDLQSSDIVIFIDCHFPTDEPVSWQKVIAGKQLMFSSHSVSMESLLYLYETSTGQNAPASYFLGIKGDNFELGQPPSFKCLEHIEQAKRLLLSKLIALHPS